MPNGWAEFLEQFKRQVESGQTDLHAFWSEFLQRSRTSPRVQGLELFANVVQKTPIEDRVIAAMLVASLLEPLEWPPEWEQHRLGLVEALESLDSIFDPTKPDSLTTLLRVGSDEVLFWNGGFMYATAFRLLSAPCRRDQLRAVARLCWVGLTNIITAYRPALARAEGAALPGPLLEARMRFAAAFDRYTQAARALNSAAGEVLFERLDERLEMPET